MTYRLHLLTCDQMLIVESLGLHRELAAEMQEPIKSLKEKIGGEDGHGSNSG